jgi:hypothetical protein
LSSNAGSRDVHNDVTPGICDGARIGDLAARCVGDQLTLSDLRWSAPVRKIRRCSVNSRLAVWSCLVQIRLT